MVNAQQPYPNGNAQGSTGHVVAVDAHAREDAVRVLQRRWNVVREERLY